MKEANSIKFGIALLVLLLAAMILIPMVSAEDTTGGTVSTNLPDVSTLTVPNLQFDLSQEKVTITSELSPEPNIQPVSSISLLATASPSTRSTHAAVPIVPYGAIIHHSTTGVTTIFDATGKQLFAADDANAAKVTTPHSESPATFVHEIPSGSIVTEYQGKTYVFYQDSLILTLINENPQTSTTHATTDITTPGIQKQLTRGTNRVAAIADNYRGWIEYAKSTAVTIDRFESTWTAPTKVPTNSGSRESLAIFNGIERLGTDGIMQPVLMWNFCASGDLAIHNEYKGAAWECLSSGNVDNMHSTPIAVSAGDTVRGTMQWSTNQNRWIIQFKNVNTGSTTSFYTTRFPRDNLILSMALEASTGVGVKKSTDSLPGTITFTDNVIKYQGNVVSSTFTGYIESGASDAFPNFDPQVTTNPLKVTLYTGW